jgi:NAD(P)-dependent dehydrogenase (short-subunit alcohol dehydrogenase family)
MNQQQAVSVFITGASSGIGRATALLLAQHGFRVFAGVRKPTDGASLASQSAGRIVSIQIDVTDPHAVATAAQSVGAQVGDAGLAGLVNNAGIGAPAPVEYMREDTLRRQFEVNVFGQISVTQAFLPLVRRAKGRIVNIGSVGSHIALPFGGALCGSKAAFTLLSDALRLELRPYGIHVCLIEPGAINTPAVEKTLGDPESIIAALPPAGAARYGDKLREFVRRGRAREASGSRPEIVAQAIHHALTARRPRLRYRVGKDAGIMVALPRLLPGRALDRVRLRLLGLSTAFGSEASQEA